MARGPTTQERAGRGCASACAVSAPCALVAATAIAFGLGGCPAPSDPGHDGGAPPADAPGSAGRVDVRIAAAEETLEDDVVLEVLRVGLAEVRAHNDRGGELDPVARALGVFDLRGGEATVPLTGAVPATYSSVVLVLGAPGAGVPSFELRLLEDGVAIHVVDEDDIEIELRCDAPVALSPGAVLELSAELDLGEVHAALRESTLPAPVSGVITVDRASAPGALAAVEARLRARWELRCEREHEP